MKLAHSKLPGSTALYTAIGTSASAHAAYGRSCGAPRRMQAWPAAKLVSASASSGTAHTPCSAMACRRPSIAVRKRGKGMRGDNDAPAHSVTAAKAPHMPSWIGSTVRAHSSSLQCAQSTRRPGSQPERKAAPAMIDAGCSRHTFSVAPSTRRCVIENACASRAIAANAAIATPARRCAIVSCCGACGAAVSLSSSSASHAAAAHSASASSPRLGGQRAASNAAASAAGVRASSSSAGGRVAPSANSNVPCSCAIAELSSPAASRSTCAPGGGRPVMAATCAARRRRSAVRRAGRGIADNAAPSPAGSDFCSKAEESIEAAHPRCGCASRAGSAPSLYSRRTSKRRTLPDVVLAMVRGGMSTMSASVMPNAATARRAAAAAAPAAAASMRALRVSHTSTTRSSEAQKAAAQPGRRAGAAASAAASRSCGATLRPRTTSTSFIRPTKNSSPSLGWVKPKSPVRK